MNPRTLYLLIGSGIVGLLYFGDQAYRTYVEKPSASREKQLAKINSSIEKANDLIAQKLFVQKQLDAYEKMSLPFDTEVTRTQYQGWLLSLVKSVGLTGITVDASQPTSVSIERQKPKQSQSKRKVVIYRYGYSLRSRGSLQQLVTFLFRFYRSGQLHKIKSISLNPSGGGTMIDASFVIEALALVRTERETELSTVQVNRLKKEDELHYVSIARRNIFSRTGNSILNHVKVTGITFGKSGKPQVWIKTDPTKPSMVFLNDDIVKIKSHQIEILDIQSNLVLLLVDGQPTKVPIGKAIFEKKEPEKSEALRPGVSKAVKNVD
ncbi:hypothetical protein N8639_00805 [bacterium]|jgi:hypothetical protein|nr:hypothetical protein [bacterium]MDB4640447.1 hypothetical protein [Pirellulaceae bacterium]